LFGIAAEYLTKEFGILSIITAIAAMNPIHGSAQEEQPGHSHAEAKAHGGEITMSERHHFEVVPTQQGLAIFVYDYEQKPVDIAGVSGSVTIVLKSGEEFEVPLTPYGKNLESGQEHGAMMRSGNEDSHMDQGGHMESSSSHAEDTHIAMAGNLLWGNYSLQDIKASKAKASITVQNLPSEKESQVQFRQTIILTDLPSGPGQIMKGPAGRSGVSDEDGDHHMNDDQRHENGGMEHDQ